MEWLKRQLIVLSICTLGACSNDDQAVNDPAYTLPYEIGKSFELIQGYGGTYSHTGNFHYSFDFEMEIGTVITASREGIVTNIAEEFTDANRTPGQENYVIIRHADGTYARYFHLTKNGALVSVGDHVTQGQQIGLSGDTGNSALPHLHFDVTTGCALPAPACQTIAIQFINSTDAVPEAGNSYEALPVVEE